MLRERQKSLNCDSERLSGKNVSRESTKGGHLRALMKELDGQAAGRGGREKKHKEKYKELFSVVLNP